jgi:hypothetical protein
MSPIVLSLCDRTGVMVEPWRAAGYQCVLVDLQHEGVTRGLDGTIRLGMDVRDFQDYESPDVYPVIVFAFPPCTDLANSGNRWKRDKGLEVLYDALGLVLACKRICEASGAPWMLENPVGSLSTYWRDPDYTFHPWEYTTPKESKRTCIWAGNNFVLPPREVVDKPPDVQETVWRMGPAPDRADRRSVTPDGWARAVFHANEPWVRTREVEPCL